MGDGDVIVQFFADKGQVASVALEDIKEYLDNVCLIRNVKGKRRKKNVRAAMEQAERFIEEEGVLWQRNALFAERKPKRAPGVRQSLRPAQKRRQAPRRATKTRRRTAEEEAEKEAAEKSRMGALAVVQMEV